jgi:thiazole synthase
MINNDKLVIGGHEFNSRFILGSGKYSLSLIKAAVENAGAEIITLAVRRANTKDQESILDHIPEGVTLLPNTSGARNAEEAVRIARLARELGCGNFVKIEIMRDTKYLLPDNAETVKATEILANEGFVVMPYMYPDLNTARDLVNAGAASVMPLASPIGSNKGLATKDFIQILIDEIDLPIIVDAGIGRPSQACEAMEMGAAAVMSNTALATAGDLTMMADAFNRQGTDLGRALQSRKIFRLMTPAGRIATLQKMLKSVEQELGAQGKLVDLTFPDWILTAASTATTEEEFNHVQKAAAQHQASKVPVNWKDKLTAWRMLSMLGNPRTHVRNVLGNALFMPAV